MLKNISLIASAISALTAITTSFRALGRSREDDFPNNTSGSRLKDLALHLFVTFVWFGLSIVFATPVIREFLSNTSDISLLQFISPFAIVVIICSLIWWKALSQRD